MRTVKRPRHYVARHWLAVGSPLLRYSEARDAYVLRFIGRKGGPVLKVDRRRRDVLHGGVERRGAHTGGSRARVA